MTISAEGTAAAGDLLDRALELYRDLSVALRERITKFKGSSGVGDVDCVKDVEALRAHHKALQTVLEIEAGLVKRNRAGVQGEGGELDLDGARAEILARLAVWAAER